MKYNEPNRALGSAIRAYRQRLGLSQERFAGLIELHRTYVGAIERGERNPSFRNLVKIATGLGIPLSELLREAEKLNSSAKGTLLENV